MGAAVASCDRLSLPDAGRNWYCRACSTVAALLFRLLPIGRALLVLFYEPDDPGNLALASLFLCLVDATRIFVLIKQLVGAASSYGCAHGRREQAWNLDGGSLGIGNLVAASS